MHVLLTNDDGILAPGIHTLGEVFSAAGHRVSVCAPDRERSAASHSTSLAAPLHAEPRQFEWAENAWAVDGTPVDCASLGLFLTRGDAPDLVIAGVNRGMNYGGAVVYSGTVGAAMEASMCGAQALAVSLCIEKWDEDFDFVPPARAALRVAEWMRGHPLPLGAFYNLNVPVLPYEDIKGIAAARLAPVFLDEPFYVREDGGWRYRGRAREFDDTGTDAAFIRQGYATLTKLTWNCRLDADDAELNGIEL
ncbi:MAG: 5'/3'-nucleotidase SurE [Clostridia bacterium]|nr:5'/3'-nucleotidase SurE [Clostridia bacterium]